MKSKQYISGVQEYASRCYWLYEYYEEYCKCNKSRKRKSLLRKAFDLWYKCPSTSGEYNEKYWQFVIDLQSGVTFREWFGHNIQALHKHQYLNIIKELLNRSEEYKEGLENIINNGILHRSNI